MEAAVFVCMFALCWAALGAQRFLRFILMAAGLAFASIVIGCLYHSYVTVPAEERRMAKLVAEQEALQAKCANKPLLDWLNGNCE